MRRGWLLILAFGSSLAGPVANAQTRLAWTASRIQGTPEPPKPFVAEQVFTQVPLSNALDMVPVPGLGQWLIAENGGKIWAVPDDMASAQADVAIDLKALHPACDHVYGIAFHPRFVENKQVFITYTNGDKLDDGSRLSRFKVMRERPLQIDPASEEILLTWLSGGHNGAAVAFGPDGFLYLSTGDAEVPAPPDPRITGQNLDDLLSCILRIDVDRKDAGKAYAVPADNPFLTTKGALPEIWAYGFRNPWKISFDRKTGGLWCGDVGWEQWENIFLVSRGGNYGWSAVEGNYTLFPERKGPTPITPPVVTHSHDEAASITGGFVYHGARLPELAGAYIYADYETGKIWALWHDGKQIARHEEIADTSAKIVTFGQAEDGELYFIHYGVPATVHRLVRNPNAGHASLFPRKLSETGLFADVARQTPEKGVVPFAIRAPMWADGASAQRFIGLPGAGDRVRTQITKRNNQRIDSKVTWPQHTVLAKTIKMELERGNTASLRNIETQVLHYDGESWAAYSYRWNDSGTDAELVGPHGDERALDLTGPEHPGGRHRHVYRFHSRAECMRCHNSWSSFALALQPQQLTDPTAQLLTALGVIDAEYLQRSTARLENPHDESHPPELRARSWLHANCAHCHRQNGGGSVPLMLNAELAVAEMRAVGEKPLRGDFGMKDAQVIAPGSPWKSVLLHRIATSGAGHMPVIGARDVDDHALGFMAEWILSLTREIQLDPLPVLTDLSSPELALDVLIMRDMLEPPRFQEAVQLAAKSPNAHIRGLFERFLPDAQRVETLGPTASAEKITAKRGDARRGAELLSPAGKAGACLACHFVNGTGRDFGPDLSKVGARLSQAQILESLLAPSKIITPPYTATVVAMQDGSSQMGFVIARDAEALSLKLATGQTARLRRSAIQAETPLPASLMPEGQLQSFTAQEAADLVAYLLSLK